ncbi:MAG TPA: endonuclease III [Anaerolineaceae bacterium]|jgi:endonuclease-3
MEKIPFDLPTVMERIRKAVQPFPKAAMFELAEKGYNTLFEQLIGCIISIRTLDEVSLPVTLRLFADAHTPEQIAQLTPQKIQQIIAPSSFAERKAGQILAIAQQVVAQYQGDLPCDEQVLLSFNGVGVKCAHLALGVACGQPAISVDIHVHRITNRWGYVSTATPEQTTLALEQILPRAYWIEINQILVPFGKHICTLHLPHCSTCPIQETCRQIGVTSHL